MSNNSSKTNMTSDGKKVLFIAGTCTHVANHHIPYIRLLQSWGYSVDVAAHSDNHLSELAPFVDNYWNVCIARAPFYPKNIWALIQLVLILKRVSYKMVHVHTPVASVIGRIACTLTNTFPVIYTTHGLYFYPGAPIINWIFYPIERILARVSDAIITINKDDFGTVSNFRLRSPGYIYELPGIGIDEERLNLYSTHNGKLLRNTYGIQEKAKVVITIAELTPNKNHIQIIRALKMIQPKFPNIIYLIVGEGKQKSYLMKVAKKMNLDNHVIFTGFQRDIASLLSISDVFVLTSKREGLGLAAIEAMVMGLPVIMTNTTGARTIIENSEIGLIVPINDISKTAFALEYILGNKKSANKMGSGARSNINKYFLSNIIDCMSQIYGIFLPMNGQAHTHDHILPETTDSTKE